MKRLLAIVERFYCVDGNTPLGCRRVQPVTNSFLLLVILLNPLKGRDVNWLQLAIQVQPTFLISDTRHPGRVPECHKLKMYRPMDGIELFEM